MEEKRYSPEENGADHVSEPMAPASTYGMSQELRDSGVLAKVHNLSHDDKLCLIRYIQEVDALTHGEDVPHGSMGFYTEDTEELNKRISEIEISMNDLEANGERAGEWFSSAEVWEKIEERHPWLR
ncbi:MAG: hypothetical protein J5932_05900 [Prevotella sp.]|nr:hypothetical protein [Prevotella sp.]